MINEKSETSLEPGIGLNLEDLGMGPHKETDDTAADPESVDKDSEHPKPEDNPEV